MTKKELLALDPKTPIYYKKMISFTESKIVKESVVRYLIGNGFKPSLSRVYLTREKVIKKG